MKKLLIALVLGVTVVALLAGPVIADPTDYDKKVAKGIYLLVSKDANWDPLPRSTSAFGMGKFSVEAGTLTMHLVAHKLTPDNWYYVEFINKDESGGWLWEIDKVAKDNQVQFYGQADASGDVDLSFSWNIDSENDYVEVNLKNADWVPLWDGATHGDPNQWIYTGQGWDGVLYGATTIPWQ